MVLKSVACRRNTEFHQETIQKVKCARQHDLANSRRVPETRPVHIPDGFLDAKTCLGTACIAGAGLTWVARGVTARWSERTVPLMGVMSAFVFAGQMVNFPVAGGTSGHLLGGVLAAVLLGPAAGAMPGAAAGAAGAMGVATTGGDADGADEVGAA